MKHLSAGQAVRTGSFTVLKYHSKRHTVEVRFQLEDYVTSPEELPISLDCFKVGSDGSGYRHPALTLYGNPEHLIWVDESKNRVKHRAFDVICHLNLDEDFYQNGQYKLTPVDGEGEIRQLVSQRWDKQTLHKYMEDMKGKSMVIEGHVFSILDTKNETFHSAITETTTVRYNNVIVFLQMEKGALHPFPLRYIETNEPLKRDDYEFDHQTRRAKRKSKRKGSV